MAVMKKFFLFVFTVSCIFACSDETPGNSLAGGSDLDTTSDADTVAFDALSDAKRREVLEGHLTEIRKLICEKAFNCCSEGEIKDQLGIAADSLDECIDSAWPRFPPGQYVQAVQTDRITYDRKQAAECEEALDNTKCSEFIPLSGYLSEQHPICGEVFQPNVAEGKQCDTDAECETGFCEVFEPEGTSEPSTRCTTGPAEGEACPNGRCGPGLFCKKQGNSFGCEPRLSTGEECSSPRQCKTLYCDSDEGVCKPRQTQPLCTGADE